MSGNPSEAGQAFTEAFRSSDSAEERQKILEEDDDYNTGRSGDGGGGDTPSGVVDGGSGGVNAGAPTPSGTDTDTEARNTDVSPSLTRGTGSGGGGGAGGESRNTDVSPSLTRGTGSGDSGGQQSGDGFTEEVARAEDLLGVDVPGDGGIVPSDPDVSAVVEERTGFNLPESAGQAVANQAGINPPTEEDVIAEAGRRARDAVSSASDAVPESPEGVNPLIFRANVEAEQRLSGVNESQAEQTVTEDFRAIDESTAESFSPAVGRNPAAGINAARGVGGIAAITGAIAGGTVAVDELTAPDRADQRQGELQPGETDVPELDVVEPTGQGELERGRTDPNEIGIPDQQQQRRPEVFRTQQIGVPRQQERQRPQDRREITEEDIAGNLGEPNQRGPSVRERQRREDLDPFERTFPTGESAVVDGTGATQDAQQRREQAQQREATRPTESLVTGQQPGMGILGLQDQDQQQGQLPVPGLDVFQTQGQATVPALDVPQVQRFGQPTEAAAGNPQAPETGNPALNETVNTEGTGTGPGRGGLRRPPRLPDFPGGDDEEEERLPFFGGSREVRTDFRNPLTGDVLDGTGGGGLPGFGELGDGDGPTVPGLPGFGD